ncbi:hypothetical protein DPSP01_010174 [Paraphaeosphaeria sporulosa]|uniref:Uncharacterized protein n=1 Tax=Paraphaeosphaeria sporulosa TaxID=1460663 RepID=A0A177CZY7_9PLEO|nr:uncharacterized protein CC84DRAFT_155125 [Paraphaeosphaeria sporulosa]OAG12658.1 hypothetical protein CC84DRAFT_155125 [Paraphaeosphaeria sporulosa]
MLLHFFLAFCFVAFAAAAPTDVLGTNTVCGFADRGVSASQYTYLALDGCRALGEAAPVRNVYRDPNCDCTFYRDADCEKHAWYLSVDYATMRTEVAQISKYYKCATRTGRGDELKKT